MRRFLADQRDVHRQIRDNPYICTMYRRGSTPDDEEASLSFVCTITLGAQRAATADRYAYGLTGELPTATSYWALLAAHDDPLLRMDDDLTVQQAEVDEEAVLGYSLIVGAEIRRFDVIDGMSYPYKREALVKEKQ